VALPPRAVAQGAPSGVAVVGAGAIGSYFGAVLARSGENVTLIGRAAHADAVNRDGLLLRSGGAEQRIRIAASSDISAVRSCGLILFCVKSLDTEHAARQMAPHLAPDAVIVSLQNGVDNPERLRRHVGHTIIPALVYAGANIPVPGVVQHTAGNSIVIGRLAELGGDQVLLARIAAVFEKAGISVRISDDITVELWMKLVMNCAYNVISALSGAPYGEMAAVPEIRDVMRAAVEEVVAVARAKDIALPGDTVDKALALARLMPTTRSSTAQDFAKGKPTEVDHLNGYVVREGDALGIATPVNRTLTALMKLVERAKPAASA
jgi:2-dehydropantoate 2-reductase